MNLTPEEQAVGLDNYYEAVGAHDQIVGRQVEGVTRRNFLKGVIAAGATSTAGLGALYFGYQKPENPVRIGIIGTGDEGGILIGALNPDYVNVVSIADIRPSSIHRALHGDWGGGNPARTHQLRPGLVQVYGYASEDQARQNIKVYENENGGYQQLLDNAKKDGVEAIIIALPLHLHAKVSIEAMQRGLHVLTEKLMGHNVAQCKVMSRVAGATNLHLATGHQRHYSVLYDNAVHLIRWGLLGEIHYIRAQWHRGNLPGRDSWAPPIPGGKQLDGRNIDVIRDQLASLESKLKRSTDASQLDLVKKQVEQWRKWDADKNVKADQHGYQPIQLENYSGSAIEELVRWRLWNRTGGGLMAELGSHQLDAASIFISALNDEKVHPLTVHAVGGRHIFPSDRDADDHVYCTFEFPAPGYEPGFDVGYKDPLTGAGEGQAIEPYEKDRNKKIVVTYSSINGNGFGGYGEVVMGTKGTLVLEKEQKVMLYKTSDTSTRVSVKGDQEGAVLDTQESGNYGPAAQAAESGPVSRGYAEEIEHWAWCIRNPAPENQPRCYPQIALGDAVIALTAKRAISKSKRGEGGYIPFNKAWFDINSDETPDDSSIKEEVKNLKVDLA